MATFLLEDADVAAVFYRTGRGPATERLRQAPYLLVTYDDGTSGLVPVPVRSQLRADAQFTVRDLEVDRIEIYDADPFDLHEFGII